MWFNTQLFIKKQLQIGDLEKLTAIKVREPNLSYFVSEDDLKRFEQLNYIKYVKPTKKGQSALELVRIDKKGSDLLLDLARTGGVDDDITVLLNWLVNVYKSREKGIVKNKKEIERQLSWFSDITGFKKNKLALLLSCFINDIYDDESVSFVEYKKYNPRAVLSNMLDNLIHKSDNLFNKHYNLDNSPLFTYYLDNKEYVEEVWRKNNIYADTEI